MNAFVELDQMLNPAHPCFTVETAANLLRIEPDAAKMVRVEELSAKANEGKLTRSEESEYWSHIYVGKLMSVLKLQARVFLKRSSS